MLKEFIEEQSEVVQYFIKNTGKTRAELAEDLEISVDTLKRLVKKGRVGSLEVNKSNINQLLAESEMDNVMLSRCMGTSPSIATRTVFKALVTPELAKKWWVEEGITLDEFALRLNVPFITSHTVHNILYTDSDYDVKRTQKGMNKRHRNTEAKELASKNRAETHSEDIMPTFTTGREAAKETNLERYGYASASSSPEIKEKVRNTNLKRYGATSYLATSTVKEKSKKTSLEKYGTEFPIQSKEIQDKIKKTSLARYGYTNPSKSYEVKVRNKQEAHDKFIPTPYARNYQEYLDIAGNKEALYTVLQSYLKDSELEYTDYNTLASLVSANPSTLNSYWGIRASEFDEVRSTFRGAQVKLLSYIKETYDTEALQESRPDFMEGFELDIYIPEYDFAIEFNGSYWHSDKFKAQAYHQNKTELARNAGVSILHVFEYDWVNPIKQDIIKSQIAYKLHSDKVKHYYARKLAVKNVSKKTADIFYDNNHIQGKSNETVDYGLYEGDELIACMGFGRKRFSKKEDNIYELIRFATKKYTSVAGGASKLFKAYLADNPEVKTVVSFANNDFAFDEDKSVYTSLGFVKDTKTSVDRYKWVKGNTTVERHQAKTAALKKSSVSEDKFQEDDTERSYMERNGYHKVWNAGTDKYVFTK